MYFILFDFHASAIFSKEKTPPPKKKGLSKEYLNARERPTFYPLAASES
jgi:hypothetical protein